MSLVVSRGASLIWEHHEFGSAKVDPFLLYKKKKIDDVHQRCSCFMFFTGSSPAKHCSASINTAFTLSPSAHTALLLSCWCADVFPTITLYYKSQNAKKVKHSLLQSICLLPSPCFPANWLQPDRGWKKGTLMRKINVWSLNICSWLFNWLSASQSINDMCT